LYSSRGPAGGGPRGGAGGGSGFESKKIFVGGLPTTVDEAQFKTYFEKFGTVTDAVVMMDRATQRSRGFGFVTFADEVSADSHQNEPKHHAS
jgi:RNA recognition motif-containing protein